MNSSIFPSALITVITLILAAMPRINKLLGDNARQTNQGGDR